MAQQRIKRDSQAVRHRAHNPKISGSNPLPAMVSQRPLYLLECGGPAPGCRVAEGKLMNLMKLHVIKCLVCYDNAIIIDHFDHAKRTPCACRPARPTRWPCPCLRRDTALESEALDYIGYLEQLRVRHSLLVDKKFLEGLTKKELNELAQINRLLDASEEKYYAPIKDALAAVRASFLEERYRSIDGI